MKPTLEDVKMFEPGVATANFEAMLEEFPPGHFEHLLQEKFRFYRTTFWANSFQNFFASVKVASKKN